MTNKPRGMVEQVADALKRHAGSPHFEDAAHAAIAAHEQALKDAGLVIVPRAPTAAMVIAGMLEGGKTVENAMSGAGFPEAWRAAIDAALKEGQ